MKVINAKKERLHIYNYHPKNSQQDIIIIIHKFIPNKAPILNKAGSETIRAKSNFRMPLAALMSLKMRPIRQTRATRRSVGETGKSSIKSSITMPTMLAITRIKSKMFHPAVKY